MRTVKYRTFEFVTVMIAILMISIIMASGLTYIFGSDTRRGKVAEIRIGEMSDVPKQLLSLDPEQHHQSLFTFRVYPDGLDIQGLWAYDQEGRVWLGKYFTNEQEEHELRWVLARKLEEEL